jgi:hypothetical protein
MNTTESKTRVFPARQILLAGMAGGAAEIVWFSIMGPVLSLNIHDLAAGVTSSIFPALGGSAYAVLLGILIHLFLSVVLAAGYIVTVGRWSMSRFGLSGQLLTGMCSLMFVWAINYLVVLPVLNPAFIEVSSYSLSLLSKTFFGITMALVFNYLKHEQKRLA